MMLGSCYAGPEADEGVGGHEAQHGGSVVGLQEGECDSGSCSVVRRYCNSMQHAQLTCAVSRYIMFLMSFFVTPGVTLLQPRLYMYRLRAHGVDCFIFRCDVQAVSIPPPLGRCAVLHVTCCSWGSSPCSKGPAALHARTFTSCVCRLFTVTFVR